MKTYGLIGFPLSHSFSKKFFTEKFETEQILDCKYELFPIEKANQFSALIATQPLLCGLNVTIPHKVNIMPFLHQIDAAAAAIGAVNCIAISYQNGNKTLKGYNTDAYGFEQSLIPLLQSYHKNALILGNGGAAKAVQYVLNKLGILYKTVVRNKVDDELQYEELTEQIIAEHTLIINTTPLGMLPLVNTCPAIPYQYLGAKHLCYDLVYNPAQTLFLANAKAKDAQIKNGMEMLVLQAERSWYIWNL